MEDLKLAGKKWDARSWTREQKIRWQEKAFKLGYSWIDGKSVKSLEKDFFVTDSSGTWIFYGDSHEHGHTSSGELLNFEDMFPEDKEEKLDVIKEITSLFSESLVDNGISDEDERGFEGLVYVEPDFKDTGTYFSILRKNCTKPNGNIYSIL